MPPPFWPKQAFCSPAPGHPADQSRGQRNVKKQQPVAEESIRQLVDEVHCPAIGRVCGSLQRSARRRRTAEYPTPITVQTASRENQRSTPGERVSAAIAMSKLAALSITRRSPSRSRISGAAARQHRGAAEGDMVVGPAQVRAHMGGDPGAPVASPAAARQLEIRAASGPALGNEFPDTDGLFHV